MTKVCIIPTPDAIRDDNGVGQVVHAQYQHLPQHDIDLTGPDQADVIACHITQAGAPRVDVLHTHGLYFDDIAHAPYLAWHHEANTLIIDAARRAHAVTVPSSWVAEPFKRDMRITPTVIGHGIDLDAWVPAASDRPFYVLWNKNRASDVCDPSPAVALASWGIDVISTFAPHGTSNLPPNLRVIGSQPHATMRELVRHASVYLATTRETFGIGTLEALAAGVPVLGYDYGGTADLIEHQVSGYLVRPGDVDGLLAGLDWLKAHPEVGAQARARAAQYSWDAVAAQYAALYHEVAEQRRSERRGVTVVITNHNYGQYVGQAIESCLHQTEVPHEIIVVDDGSTDDSRTVLSRYEGRVAVVSQDNAGVAAARNTGIARATGQFVACLDADDTLHPEYCRVLSRALVEDRSLGVAYSGLGLLQDNGTVNPNAWPPDFSWAAQTTVANPPSNCIPCAAMFRRAMWERAGGYKQVYAPGEDTEFFTRGLSVGFTAKRITPEPLFQYRMHSGSASRTKEYKPIDTWHPWMRDGLYPMAAPADRPVLARSYADPLISVIIPVGPGHAQYLPTALESLLGQTLRQWEVIVAADGDHGALTTALGRTYPFVRRASTERTGSGPGAARNAGIAMARAPLMLFLDADDYLAPDALEKMLRLYIDSDGQYIYSDWFALRGGQMEAHQVDDYTQAGWLERGVHAVTALIPSEHVRGVGGFDETMRGWEDWDFFIKLAISGVCGRRLPEPLLIYRQHTGTIRERSLTNKDELLAALKDRYAKYATGDEAMSSCCGGNADTLLAAKAALARANGPAGAEAAFLPIQSAASEGPSTARLKFIGKQRGAMTFVGKPSGRQYRFGNNALEQYGDVDPRDVAHFLTFPDFELVYQPAQPIIAPQAEAAPVAQLVQSGSERPMLDLAGDMSTELEALVNQQTQHLRQKVRETSV